MSIDKSNGPGDPPRWNVQIEDSLKKFPIHIQTNEAIHRTSWHRQPGLEIHITHEGKGVFVSEGTVLLQQSRDVVIHQGDKPHQMIALAKQAYRRTVVCFDPALYHGLNPGGLNGNSLETGAPLQIRLDSKTYTGLIDLCARLEREIREKAAGWEEMTLAHLLEIIVLLRRQQLSSDQEAQGQGAGAAAGSLQTIPQLVQQCMAYVSLHLDEDLSLSGMAARFSLSEEHLTRSFRKEIGVSFHQFVLAARVDRGRQLLAEAPELTVLEVALQSGFSSLAHFSHTFKNVTGENPTQFKARTAADKKTNRK